MNTSAGLLRTGYTCHQYIWSLIDHRGRLRTFPINPFALPVMLTVQFLFSFRVQSVK